METSNTEVIIKTDLDAFNFVVQKLLEQNDRCMDEDDTCRYRGFTQKTIEHFRQKAINNNDDELDNYYDYFRDMLSCAPYDAKCAVGHLIDDDVYDSSIEGEAINEIVVEMLKESHPAWTITNNSFSMLINLQKIHDSFTPSLWKSEFKKLDKLFDEHGSYLLERGSYISE